MTDPIELEFSKKYTLDHSEHYAEKHHASLLRRISNWREQAIGRNSLKMAGDPNVVLDLPCGAGGSGRSWRKNPIVQYMRQTIVGLWLKWPNGFAIPISLPEFKPFSLLLSIYSFPMNQWIVFSVCGYCIISAIRNTVLSC